MRKNLIETQIGKSLFSGNTMLDGVLKLNKLSRGLFLSWSVNAVILGAGAAKSNAQKPHRGIQLSLYLPHPARHTLSSLFLLLSHPHASFTPHIFAPSQHLYLFSLYLFPVSLSPFSSPCLSYGKSLFSVSEYFAYH